MCGMGDNAIPSPTKARQKYHNRLNGGRRWGEIRWGWFQDRYPAVCKVSGRRWPNAVLNRIMVQ